MFQFSDQQQNPFTAMFNPENRNPGENNTAAMQFMQQAWMMQMQLMQNMVMMPMYFMQGMMALMGQNTDDAEKSAAGQGFKLGSMEIPPELFGMLLKMDMSPENLEKLQKVLDFVFGIMPGSKTAAPAEGNEAE